MDPSLSLLAHSAGCKVVTVQSRCIDSAPPLLPPPSFACWSLTPCSCAAELQDLLPGIINQLGPDNLANLKKLASQYQGAAAAGDAQDEEEDDDDVPDLVEGEPTGSPDTHPSWFSSWTHGPYVCKLRTLMEQKLPAISLS
jgi:hypothetical protein